MLETHVLRHSVPGDAASVLSAVDAFERNCVRHSMAIGKAKAERITHLFERCDRILELGTYYGYSALALAADSPSRHIDTLDHRPLCVAQRLWQRAGLESRINQLTGQVADAGVDFRPPYDGLFMDHGKKVYERDLQWLVQHGVIDANSTLIVVDNVTPEFCAAFPSLSPLTSLRDDGRHDGMATGRFAEKG